MTHSIKKGAFRENILESKESIRLILFNRMTNNN